VVEPLRAPLRLLACIPSISFLPFFFFFFFLFLFFPLSFLSFLAQTFVCWDFSRSQSALAKPLCLLFSSLSFPFTIPLLLDPITSTNISQSQSLSLTISPKSSLHIVQVDTTMYFLVYYATLSIPVCCSLSQ
jgi:hypothetical protein